MLSFLFVTVFKCICYYSIFYQATGDLVLRPRTRPPATSYWGLFSELSWWISILFSWMVTTLASLKKLLFYSVWIIFQYFMLDGDILFYSIFMTLNFGIGVESFRNAYLSYIHCCYSQNWHEYWNVLDRTELILWQAESWSNFT